MIAPQLTLLGQKVEDLLVLKPNNKQGEIIAHRGFSAIAPENTLIAFKKAIENEATGVEFDLQLSGDYHFVIIHDPTVDRISETQGKVAELTLKELKTLDVGSWFNQEFKGEKIPTLREVLDLFANTILTLYIEVKECYYWRDQDINNLVKLLTKYQNNIYLISFDHQFLNRVRQQSSLIKIGYNVKTKADYLQALELAKKNQGHCICSEYHLLLNNPFLIKKAQEYNLKVLAWTVDNLEEINQLKQLNIQGIMTNRIQNLICSRIS